MKQPPQGWCLGDVPPSSSAQWNAVYAVDVCLNVASVQLSRTHSTEEDCVDNIPTH